MLTALGGLWLTGDVGHTLAAQEPLRGRILLSVLFFIVTFLAHYFPATGPRYAEKSPLTPLVALVALVRLPPLYAAAPIAAAGLLLSMFEPELARRRALSERYLLVLAAQLWTSLALHGLYVGGAREIASAGALQIMIVGVGTTATFGACYFAGLWLLMPRGAHPRGHRAASLARRNWNIAWGNEAVVFAFGGTVATMLGLVLTRSRTLLGFAVLLTVSAGCVLISKGLVEGDMMRRQLSALDRLTQNASIRKYPNIQRYMVDFLDHCERLILFDCAAVWLYNEREMVLEKILGYSGSELTFERDVRHLGEHLVGRAAERGKPMLIDDVRRDPGHKDHCLSEAEKRQTGPVSGMLMPFLAGGELIGLVEFERGSLAPYTAEDSARIQSLAGLVGVTIANHRQHQGVVQQAVTDALTNLCNKRQILNTLRAECVRAHRYGSSLSVMMLDLDKFKSFNDTYGHVQGDKLLRRLAALIKESIRTTDIAGRYGGEEFMVVMPETGREAALIIAERIRSRIAAEPFEVGVTERADASADIRLNERNVGSVVVRKTISIGMATFPDEFSDAEGLLACADEALYKAKKQGRNRVVPASCEPEPEMGRSATALNSKSSNQAVLGL